VLPVDTGVNVAQRSFVMGECFSAFELPSSVFTKRIASGAALDGSQKAIFYCNCLEGKKKNSPIQYQSVLVGRGKVASGRVPRDSSKKGVVFVHRSTARGGCREPSNVLALLHVPQKDVARAVADQHRVWIVRVGQDAHYKTVLWRRRLGGERAGDRVGRQRCTSHVEQPHDTIGRTKNQPAGTRHHLDRGDPVKKTTAFEKQTKSDAANGDTYADLLSWRVSAALAVACRRPVDRSNTMILLRSSTHTSRPFTAKLSAQPPTPPFVFYLVRVKDHLLDAKVAGQLQRPLDVKLCDCARAGHAHLQVRLAVHTHEPMGVADREQALHGIERDDVWRARKAVPCRLQPVSHSCSVSFHQGGGDGPVTLSNVTCTSLNTSGFTAWLKCSVDGSGIATVGLLPTEADDKLPAARLALALPLVLGRAALAFVPRRSDAKSDMTGRLTRGKWRFCQKQYKVKRSPAR